jgi:hypothetical protein
MQHRFYKSLAFFVLFIGLQHPAGASEAVRKDFLEAFPAFAWDDAPKGTGLHTRLRGVAVSKDRTSQITWEARELELGNEKDKGFLERFFTDPDRMKYYVSGKPYDKETIKETIQARINQNWGPHYRNGFPRGKHMIFDTETDQPVGFFLIFPDSESGAAEVGYGVDKKYEGKGLCSSFVGAFCEEWALQVAALGDLGNSRPVYQNIEDQEKTNEEDPRIKYASIIKNFRYFKDESLKKFVLTFHPANVGSLKIALKKGFQSPKAPEEKPYEQLKDFSKGKRKSKGKKKQVQGAKADLLDYFTGSKLHPSSKKAIQPLVDKLKANPDVKYSFIGKEGTTWVVSWKKLYDQPRIYLEKTVVRKVSE